MRPRSFTPEPVKHRTGAHPSSCESLPRTPDRDPSPTAPSSPGQASSTSSIRATSSTAGVPSTLPATRHPNRMICGQRVGTNCHAAVQLRGSSRLGDGSVAFECDRSCVVTSRAHFSFDRHGAAAMIALFAVGFLAACGGGNGSAGGTLTSGGTRTTPTRSTPTVTAPTRSTPTVTESQTTTVVAVTPPPATTTVSGTTTTSGVSPAAAAAAAAAAASQNDDESDSTQWGWIAFAILAAAVLIGGIVWWWRRHSAQAKTKTPGPGDPPDGSSSALPD